MENQMDRSTLLRILRERLVEVVLKDGFASEEATAILMKLKVIVAQMHADGTIKERNNYEKCGAANKGRRWINNGRITRMYDPKQPLPDGWEYGHLTFRRDKRHDV